VSAQRCSRPRYCNDALLAGPARDSQKVLKIRRCFCEDTGAQPNRGNRLNFDTLLGQSFCQSILVLPGWRVPRMHPTVNCHTPPGLQQHSLFVSWAARLKDRKAMAHLAKDLSQGPFGNVILQPGFLNTYVFITALFVRRILCLGEMTPHFRQHFWPFLEPVAEPHP
jgi:hypothetical protein